jgi:hypothetical protein
MPRACTRIVNRSLNVRFSPKADKYQRVSVSPLWARSEQLYALAIENSALLAPPVRYAARDPCAGAGQAAPFSQAVLPFVVIALG